MIPILGAAIPPLNSLNLPSTSLVRDWLKPSYSEMNGIIGMTELALDTKLTAEQCVDLGMVKRSAASLLTLIRDILDFSKIEAGKLDLDVSDFPLRESVGETLKTLGFRAHQRGFELAWRVAPDVPDSLAGKSGRRR